MRDYILIGQFLRNEGIVSEADVINARKMQKTHNRRIGERFVEKGWLKPDDVETILILQEEDMKRFGEITVERGMLTNQQVDETIEEGKDNYLFIGEALCRLGAIKDDILQARLNEFHSLCRSNDSKVSRVTIF